MRSLYKIILAILALLALATPFVLDSMQKVHDQLSILYVRPEGGVTPAPGENFAITAATIAFICIYVAGFAACSRTT